MGSGLAELDLDTGLIEPVEGVSPYSSALAINGDQVFINVDDWPDINALQFRNLSGWAEDSFTEMPLYYGAEVLMGSSRIIYDLDVAPGRGNLYALVLRADNSWRSLDLEGRPNVLASISENGVVTGMVELPTSTQSLAGTFNQILADGFESDTNVNGCYDLSDGGTNGYWDWIYGANTVSTSDTSPVNDRPLSGNRCRFSFKTRAACRSPVAAR